MFDRSKSTIRCFRGCGSFRWPVPRHFPTRAVTRSRHLRHRAPKPVFDRPDSDEELAFSSIRQLGNLLRNRKISSVELTKLYLERLRRYDPLLKCVVTFMDELALKQAERADQRTAGEE